MIMGLGHKSQMVTPVNSSFQFPIFSFKDVLVIKSTVWGSYNRHFGFWQNIAFYHILTYFFLTSLNKYATNETLN